MSTAPHDKDNDKGDDKGNRNVRKALLITAGRLVLISAMLLLVTAMANRNISTFVYRGF